MELITVLQGEPLSAGEIPTSPSPPPSSPRGPSQIFIQWRPLVALSVICASRMLCAPRRLGPRESVSSISRHNCALQINQEQPPPHYAAELVCPGSGPGKGAGKQNLDIPQTPPPHPFLPPALPCPARCHPLGSSRHNQQLFFFTLFFFFK